MTVFFCDKVVDKMKTCWVEYLANGTMVQAKFHGPMRLTMTARGEIGEFSRASRKRMFDWLHTVDLEAAGRAIFVTLTYGQASPDGRQSKRHLDTFLKRLVRQHSKASGLWRMEYQARGAIHYHLIVWGVDFLDKAEVQQSWSEVIGDAYMDKSHETPRAPFTRVERIRSIHGVRWYVGKYLGKTTTVDQAAGGTPARAAPGTGFNSGAYFTARTVVRRDGRHWGVFNRRSVARDKMVSLMASPVCEFTDKMAEVAQKGLAAKVVGGNGTFTLYLQDGETAGQALERMMDAAGMFMREKAYAEV